MRRLIERLIEAVRPFARACYVHDADTLQMANPTPDDKPIMTATGSWSGPTTITYGDLRKLSQALRDVQSESQRYRQDLDEGKHRPELIAVPFEQMSRDLAIDWQATLFSQEGRVDIFRWLVTNNVTASMAYRVAESLSGPEPDDVMVASLFLIVKSLLYPDADTTIVCPSCQGSLSMPIAHARYVRGYTGPPLTSLPCQRCEGRGHISARMLTWIAYGKELRRIREQELALGLREAADLWGMKASELSDIECGKVDNTDWTVPNYGGELPRSDQPSDSGPDAEEPERDSGPAGAELF